VAVALGGGANGGDQWPLRFEPNDFFIMKPKLPLLFAAGTAAVINAEDPLPEWIQLAPLGEWPTRDRKNVQVFNAEACAQMVQWFDFWPRRVARLMGVNAVPVWVGHPDFDPKTWPERKQVGHVAKLEARDDGLWGNVIWNANADEALRKDGHKFPSVAVDCDDAGDGKLNPVMLMSVGMWHKPNIKSVQSVVNAQAETEDDQDEKNDETQTNAETAMLNKLLTALREAGVIKEGDDEDSVLVQVGNLKETLEYYREDKARMKARADKMRTAMNAGEEIEDADLDDAVITALNAERSRAEALRLSFEALRADLYEVQINTAIETGRIVEADRTEWLTELNAAEDSTPVLERLRALKPQLNTASIGALGRNKPALTAAQRRTTLNAWVNDYMVAKGCDYDKAWQASKVDPETKGIHEAMAADKTAAE
jgi:hypothetical protein